MVPDVIWRRIERWLNLRPHSRWEIKFYVSRRIKKWQTKAEVDEKDILGMIEKARYINDEAFAKWWAEGRVEFKRFGPIRIKAELMQKHVDQAIIAAVIKNVVEPVVDELVKSNRESMKKKYRDDEIKLKQALLRKGFTFDQIA